MVQLTAAPYAAQAAQGLHGNPTCVGAIIPLIPFLSVEFPDPLAYGLRLFSDNTNVTLALIKCSKAKLF